MIYMILANILSCSSITSSPTNNETENIPNNDENNETEEQIQRISITKEDLQAIAELINQSNLINNINNREAIINLPLLLDTTKSNNEINSDIILNLKSFGDSFNESENVRTNAPTIGELRNTNIINPNATREQKRDFIFSLLKIYSVNTLTSDLQGDQDYNNILNEFTKLKNIEIDTRITSIINSAFETRHLELFENFSIEDLDDLINEVKKGINIYNNLNDITLGLVSSLVSNGVYANNDGTIKLTHADDILDTIFVSQKLISLKGVHKITNDNNEIVRHQLNLLKIRNAITYQRDNEFKDEETDPEKQNFKADLTFLESEQNNDGIYVDNINGSSSNPTPFRKNTAEYIAPILYLFFFEPDTTDINDPNDVAYLEAINDYKNAERMNEAKLIELIDKINNIE